LKLFRVRIAYVDAGVSGQGTTILLGGDEADNDETDQAKNEAAALEVEGGVEMEGENKVFPDKSYISEDRMFAVVVWKHIPSLFSLFSSFSSLLA
jgi:hypothetical protein